MSSSCTKCIGTNVLFWFAGWGTNEGLIISILAHRNAAQRNLIRQVYAEAYGQDLLKDLDKELSSDFEVSLLHLMLVLISAILPL